jgi:outer membrane murein-binding lipoprotein Lpp
VFTARPIPSTHFNPETCVQKDEKWADAQTGSEKKRVLVGKVQVHGNQENARTGRTGQKKETENKPNTEEAETETLLTLRQGVLAANEKASRLAEELAASALEHRQECVTLKSEMEHTMGVIESDLDEATEKVIRLTSQLKARDIQHSRLLASALEAKSDQHATDVHRLQAEVARLTSEPREQEVAAAEEVRRLAAETLLTLRQDVLAANEKASRLAEELAASALEHRQECVTLKSEMEHTMGVIESDLDEATEKVIRLTSQLKARDIQHSRLLASALEAKSDQYTTDVHRLQAEVARLTSELREQEVAGAEEVRRLAAEVERFASDAENKPYFFHLFIGQIVSSISECATFAAGDLRKELSARGLPIQGLKVKICLPA